MKKSKILVPALAMLVMSTAATVSGTVAWFTTNNTVSAKGMVVKAKAEGSLAISATAPSASTTTVTHNFSDATATELYASTHDWELAGSTTGLKYITNSDLISADTGLPYTAEDEGNLDYADAKNTTGSDAKTFYKDYSVFISSAGDTMSNQKIKVAIDVAKNTTINGAISIDFYASTTATGTAITPASTNFINTLNLAQLDAAKNDATTALTYFYIGESGINIPKNSTTTGISVVMRVYYDGALKNKDVTTNYLLTEAAAVSDAEQTVYDNRGGAVTVPANGAVTGYYANINSDCDTTYAKNVDMQYIADIQLAVKFTAETVA